MAVKPAASVPNKPDKSQVIKLYHFLESHGYQLCLLHSRQTHQFAQQRGLRAKKSDKLDAITIARVLLSGEARPG